MRGRKCESVSQGRGRCGKKEREGTREKERERVSQGREAGREGGREGIEEECKDIIMIWFKVVLYQPPTHSIHTISNYGSSSSMHLYRD